MKTEQILNADIEDIEDLTRAELAKMVSQAARAANIRVKSLQEHKIINADLLDVYSSGGKFSVRGKDKTSLLNEFKRIRSFMGGSTTVREAKEETQNIIDRMRERGVIDENDIRTSEDIMRELWETMDKLRETRPAAFVNDCLLYSDDVYSEIEKGKSASEAYEAVIDKIDQENKKMKEEERQKVTEWETELGWII